MLPSASTWVGVTSRIEPFGGLAEPRPSAVPVVWRTTPVPIVQGVVKARASAAAEIDPRASST